MSSLSQECVECCVHALSELLLSYKLGSEKWVAALRDTYSQLNRLDHMTLM